MTPAEYHDQLTAQRRRELHAVAIGENSSAIEVLHPDGTTGWYDDLEQLTVENVPFTISIRPQKSIT